MNNLKLSPIERGAVDMFAMLAERAGEHVSIIATEEGAEFVAITDGPSLIRHADGWLAHDPHGQTIATAGTLVEVLDVVAWWAPRGAVRRAA